MTVVPNSKNDAPDWPLNYSGNQQQETLIKNCFEELNRDMLKNILDEIHEVDKLKVEWLKTYIVRLYPTNPNISKRDLELDGLYVEEEFVYGGLTMTYLYYKRRIIGVFAYRYAVDENNHNSIMFNHTKLEDM